MSHLKSWLSEHSDFTMKAVFVLLVCLPFLFANTVDESALKAYKRMNPQERLSGRLCLFCFLWFVSSWIFYVLKLIFFKSRSILLTLEARKPLYYCLFVLFTKQTTKCNFNKFLICIFTNNESKTFIYLFFSFWYPFVSVHQAYESIKNWLASHGTAMSAGACSITCASATALETMGISAPICAAACAL